MFLLLWLAVLFAYTGTSSGKSNKNKDKQTCTVPADKCTNGQNETSIWLSCGPDPNQCLNVTINLSAERKGTNVTCRVHLTGTREKTETLNLTVTADLQNSMRNEPQPMCNCTASTSNTTNTNISNLDGSTNWREGSMMMFLEAVQKPEVISAFLMGFLLATLVSTVVCCLMRKSHSKKMKIYGNLSEALEMTNDPAAAAGPGASAAGHSDVDYSTIKFSAVRAKKLEETTETEYAEIKREETVQEEEGEGSQEERAIMGEVEVEVEVEAEGGGMMEDEDAALCPDVEVVGEMEACSA